jgi:hypothetical protein
MAKSKVQMIKALFVTKRFNSYADAFLMLGLARIAEYALAKTNQKTEMQLFDEGTRYRIEFKKPVDLGAIAQLSYTDPFPPVCGRTTDRSQIPNDAEIFDTVVKSQERRLYWNAKFKNRVQTDTGEYIPDPDPKTQNGVALTAMRSDKNHNGIWQEGRKVQDSYTYLITALLEAFSQEFYLNKNGDFEAVAALFKEKTQSQLPEQVRAVQVYVPIAVEGINRVKADGNTVMYRKKADWSMLWLIANGFFTFAISEIVKVASKNELRILALEPQDISFSKYQRVLADLRKFNNLSGIHGTARFDAELVLLVCKEILKYHQSQATEKPENDLDIRKPINQFIGGFAGTGFVSKGQVYGVKELFYLGLPGWIHPSNYQQIADYKTALDEHLSVVRSLSTEINSELLAAYRDFITGNDLQKFFRFQVSYADYAVKCLADTKAKPPRLFSLQGLKLMMQNFKQRKDDQEWSLTEITEDPGFLNIAKAINSATVYAGTVIDKNGKQKETGWDRIHGLAQRLSSQSGSKKDFIIEISAFLASYENENLRKQEKFRRVWTTKDDLDRVIHLVDKFGSSLVANLLIAYGYAKGWGKAKDREQPDFPEAMNENSDLSHEEFEELEQFDEGESNDDE